MQYQHTENSVADFLNQSFCTWPVDESIIDDATGAYLALIEACRESTDSWSLTRPGEEPKGPEDKHGGPDVGLIDLTDGKTKGRDIKWFFHYAPDLVQLANQSGLSITPQMREGIKAMHRAYLHINQQICLFAAQLEEAVPGYFVKPGFAGRLEKTAQDFRPFTTTTLRGLWYPDVPAQKGAKLHIDRSTLTGHCGDKNGELFALVGKNQERIVISPPRGHMVIFPGVRILFETNGRLRPLPHGSTNQPGKDRMAMVQFGHTDIGYEVRDNKTAQTDFWEHFHQSEV